MRMRESVLILFIYFVSTSAAWACSCFVPTPSVEWYNSYDLVFTGEATGVTRSSDPNGYDFYSLTVSEVFKGDVNPSTEIVSDYASCKWNIPLGATLTFFTYTINNDGGELISASICSPTDLASNVDTDILRAAFPCSDVLPLGDGWGWDGTESCEFSSGGSVVNTECVDPDGDGWGWDGSASCQVDGGNIVVTECIDTDGDGWGWNGSESCRIDSVIKECIDTDGDGWGWDGSSSCQI